MDTINILKAKINLKKRFKTKRRHLNKEFKKATSDFNKIIDLIIKNYNPKRIYQWGSLLDKEKFSNISDIDIAVEGLSSVEEFFKIYGDAMNSTSFPIDVVEIDKIEPEFREQIIKYGKLIYERKK